VGKRFDSAVELDQAYVMQTYARKPVLFVRGEGMRLYDDEGGEYLDFVSGIGAVNLGHAHPAVAKAISEQSSRLVHVSNLFYTEHRGELAEKVAGLLAADGGSEAGDWRMFFANSGTEAS
jgi:acetylornithine aminotransferase